MTGKNQQNCFMTPELTHRIELILHLLEYSSKLVVVKGEPGSGKTTFFEELSRQDESNLIIRSLTVSALTNANDIYHALIDGTRQDKLQESEYGQAELNQWLTRCQNKQEIPALLIDNADLLDDDLITQLFNILKKSNEVSVLHVCLFCEPSFLQQLERIENNGDDPDNLHIIEMPNLSEKQTEQYIHSNYPTDNSSNLNLFDEKTIKQIHRISHGLPGRINALCEQYLDDPAKETEKVKEKKPSVNIKALFIKNKLILTVTVLLMTLSIGIAILLQQVEEEEVKQTIKLNLPKNNIKTTADDIVEIQVPEELEPEPVTIEELSPPVIPEIAKDLNNKSSVTVYNEQGQVIAQESDLKPVAIDEVVKSNVPIIVTPEEPESTVQTLPEPANVNEAESVKIPEPVSESKPEPEPVKTVEPEPEPVVKDIKWLTKQDPDKYVLQLIGAYEQETIDVYLRAFKDNEHKIISFNATNKGKTWHVLVYGLFENRDQAVAAIETLPTKAKLMAPWPRSVQSIKDLLK